MIEFIEEEHLYLLDGVIIPSVSEILHFIFPSKYLNVPKEVLNAKASYGTTIHEIIEKVEKNKEISNLNYIQEASLNQYLRLKQERKIEVLKQEQIVHYEDKYAGRFDMIANVKNEYSLCDIKTTSILDKEYLSWQLSLYAFAKNEKFDKLYAIWLPKKDLGQLVEINRKTDEEILKILKQFQERKNYRE